MGSWPASLDTSLPMAVSAAGGEPPCHRPARDARRRASGRQRERPTASCCASRPGPGCGGSFFFRSLGPCSNDCDEFTRTSHTPHHTLARPISRSRLWWLLVLIPGAARRRACTDAAHRQLPSPRLRPSLLALAALPRAYVFFLSFPKCRRPISAISHKLIPQVPCGYRLLAPSSQR